MLFLQPLLYNYVGTSTPDEDRDKDHKLDHDLWSFSNLLPMLQLRLQQLLWSLQRLQLHGMEL